MSSFENISFNLIILGSSVIISGEDICFTKLAHNACNSASVFSLYQAIIKSTSSFISSFIFARGVSHS
jgi:hypothetical protein